MLLTFSHPWALFLLVAMPPLLWWFQRSGRGALRFSQLNFGEPLPAGRGRRARRAGLIMRALGLGLLIVAIAGPRWPDESTRIPAEGIAIAMVVDVSASMASTDVAWHGAVVSRLDAAKQSFRQFVAGGDQQGDQHFSGRKHDLIGLVAFAAQPNTACPLTLDHQTLLKVLDGLQPRTVAEEGRTNPGDALAWALY